LLLVKPTASFDIVQMTEGGTIAEISALSHFDIWINGGSSCFAIKIFGYIHPGEELVRQPFQRLIEKGAVLLTSAPDSGSCMDTFKDKQRLEVLNQVWRLGRSGVGSPPHSSMSRNLC
jgi:glucose-1-phosphate cytidylyltransferase